MAYKTDSDLALLAYLLGRNGDVDKTKRNQSMSLIVSEMKQISRLRNRTRLHFSRWSMNTSQKRGKLSRGLNGRQGWTVHKQRELS